MEGILKNIRLFAREKEDREAMEQYRDLLRDLELLRAQIERVDSNFNMTTDEDLVESYIYESNALGPAIVFCCGRQRNKSPVWGIRSSPSE